MQLVSSPRVGSGLVLIVALLGLLPRPVMAATETLAESRTMAVKELVLDILSYTRWPSEPPVLRICVVAPTEYAGALFTIDRQANGRTVQVHRYEVSDPALPNSCDVLYLGVVSEQTRISLFSSLMGHQTLSISEHNSECSSSTVFCLQPERDSLRMRFKVNLDALALSGVKVHPAVLKLARADLQATP